MSKLFPRFKFFLSCFILVISHLVCVCVCVVHVISAGLSLFLS
jgi:hypothetical protein